MKSYKIKHKNGNICWYLKEPIKFLSIYKVKFKDGEVSYWNNYLHREDGPAVEWIDGNKDYYFNGKLHRENGPAIVRTHGSNKWFWHGKWLSEIRSQEEFELWKRFRNFQ